MRSAADAARSAFSSDTTESRGNLFKKGLDKVKGVVAGGVGDALGKAKDLGTHIPRPHAPHLPHPSMPHIPHPNLPKPHLPNINVSGVKDAAGRAVHRAGGAIGGIAGGAGEKIGGAAGAVGGALGGVGHLAVEGTKLPSRGVEALIGSMGHALENKRAFGKSIAEFALHGAATRGLSMGSKELARSVLVWSGAAGAIGGGLTGTVFAGAFVGAMSGALVEYARQVNKNLDREAAADPSIAGQRAAFALKFKEFHHIRVLKPNDTRRIIEGGVFGAIAGAGAGALIENEELAALLRKIPGVSGIGDAIGKVGETIGNIPGVRGAGGAVRETAGGIKDAGINTAGDVWNEAGKTVSGIGILNGDDIGSAVNSVPGVEGAKGIAGGAWNGTGEAISSHIPSGDNIGNALNQVPGVGGAKDLAGGTGNLVNQVPGVGGTKDIAGGLWSGAGGVKDTVAQTAGDLWSGAGGVKDAATRAVGLNNAPNVAGQAVDQAAQEVTGETVRDAVPEGFVSQADYDALNQQLAGANEQLSKANNTIADLQKQFEEAKKAAGGVPETAGVAGTVAQTAEQAATQALEAIGNNIPLQEGSNPWEVSTTVLKQMGIANPTPAQIMQLDKVFCQENNIGVPAWGIKGTIDARNLPVGFNLNLTDTVKKTALEIASKK